MDVPSLRQQHDIRKAEIVPNQNAFHSRLFYIRQSDEKVDLGEIVSFRSEFDANLDLKQATSGSKAKPDSFIDGIFGNKKFYLQIEMRFKEATAEEIKCQEKLKT